MSHRGGLIGERQMGRGEESVSQAAGSYLSWDLINKEDVQRSECFSDFVGYYADFFSGPGTLRRRQLARIRVAQEICRRR